MSIRRKLIGGNWKMNGSRTMAEALAKGLVARCSERPDATFDLLICPPAPLIWSVAHVIAETPVLLGGQDCHPEASGAHTGDTAAPMLREAGCSHVIVGHSERRQNHSETNLLVQAKAKAAMAADLVPIICVGETETERDRGEASAVVADQVESSIPSGAGPESLVIAYEPVWAIGTGRTASPADVQEMHAHIRSVLTTRLASADTVRILYGGSVKPSSAQALLALPDVDGALVGGASLKAEDFWLIATSCP